MMSKFPDEDDGRLELQLKLGIRGSCGSGNKHRTRIIPSSSSSSSSSGCSSTSSSSLFATPAPSATTLDHANAAAVTHVVGWPPVRRAHIHRISTTANGLTPYFDSVFNTSKTTGTVFISRLLQSHNSKGGAIVNDKHGRFHPHFVSPYVKVTMDGYPIGRKIDLASFHSYETLAHKLEDMFFNSQLSATSLFIGSDPQKNIKAEARQTTSKLLMGSSDFVLTFEDNEGDWMLVGDVPWRMFCNSVRRLRIMRTYATTSMPLVI